MNPETFLLQGGMDLATPAIAVAAGRARAATNYEATERGYRRCDGIERFDGRPSPSDATVLYFRYSGLVSAIPSSGVLTGGTSGATGYVLTAVADEPIETDDEYWASSTTALASTTLIRASSVPTDSVQSVTGYVVLRDVTGTFQIGELLKSGATTLATISTVPAVNAGPTVALSAEYLNTAADARRAAIQKVPGVGVVRGVAVYGDDVYAWRNSETTCKMWRATAAGWTEVSLGHTLAFTNGTAAYVEGQTITRGGVTAIIRKVVVTSGAWSGTAAGRLVISGATGTFTAGVATTPTGSATLTGAQVAFTIPNFAGVNGQNTVRTTLYDFGQGERLYVATGGTHAFEFDGTYAYPIFAPVASDCPLLVAAYSNHLFLLYSQGSMIFSEIGDPMVFSTTGGAGEIAIGSYPRDVIESAGTALMVICRTKIGYLTGSSAADFDFKELSKEAGGWGRSAQNIGRVVYLDQRGLRDISASQNFGNFSMGTLSNDVASIFRSYEQGQIVPLCSVRCVAKDQYRAFFSDGTGLTFYFGRNTSKPEITAFIMPVMNCAVSDAANDSAAFSNSERIFAGGKDGYVYQLDKGRSYDGAEIEAWVRLPFNMIGSSQANKRFHSVDLELDAAETTTLSVSATFDYDSAERPAGIEETVTTYGAGGYWDEANLDEFNWDSPISGTLHSRIDGVGQSVALLILSKTKTEDPHTLTSARINWTPRKYRR